MSDEREKLPPTPHPPNPFQTGKKIEREPEPKPADPSTAKPKGPKDIKRKYQQWAAMYGQELQSNPVARTMFPQLTTELRNLEEAEPHYIVSLPVLDGGQHKMMLNPAFDWN